MENIIGVGLGERVISRNPEDVITAYGLGSCLGIGIFDPKNKIAGLLHVVLPEKMNGAGDDSLKFISSGLPFFIKEMIKAGGDKQKMIIRMAGGANMIAVGPFAKAFDIGTRNIAAAHQMLDQLNMRLTAEDIGGNMGRTVRLYVKDGRMTVRMIGGAEKEL